ARNTTLKWAGPGATSYNIAFGTSYPPPLVATGLASANYKPPSLLANAVYYWQLTAINAVGSTPGPLWAFTTAPASVGDDVLVRDAFTDSNGTAITAHTPDVDRPGAFYTVTGASPTPTVTNNTVGITGGGGHLQATLDVGAADIQMAADVKVPASGNFL